MATLKIKESFCWIFEVFICNISIKKEQFTSIMYLLSLEPVAYSLLSVAQVTMMEHSFLHDEAWALW